MRRTKTHTCVDRLDLLIAEMQDTLEVTEVFDFSQQRKTLPQLPLMTTGFTFGDLRGSREQTSVCAEHFLFVYMQVGMQIIIIFIGLFV